MDSTIISSLISASATFAATFCAIVPALIALFFTARQLRETAKQTKNLEYTLRTSVYQDTIKGEREMWIAFFLEQPDMLKWYLEQIAFESKGGTEDKIKLFFILRFDFFENLFLQYREGIISEDVFSGWRRVMEVAYSKKHTQEIWKNLAQYYSPTFRAFTDEITPKSKGTT